MSDSRGSKGLNVLATLYLIGAFIAVLVIFANCGLNEYDRHRFGDA